MSHEFVEDCSQLEVLTAETVLQNLQNGKRNRLHFESYNTIIIFTFHFSLFLGLLFVMFASIFIMCLFV